ncbi:MAG: M20/M25/M40 family metallo-hydrolase [Methylobacteriaceae bacterium]|nr:M20/M25/M40 family metallo-hydrolase [Methylobacteriaceae bacterium]
MRSLNRLLQEIDAEILAAREQLVELCGRLVAAPSESPPGRTVEVAKIVEAFLNANAIATDIVAGDPEAPNIVGRVNEKEGRHVVFNAHMDTMWPGDESKWSVPILQLTRRDGRLYGLGMGNMKGALAAMCVASAVLARHRNSLPGRLTMTAVCDEVMFGERGAVHLLQARPDVHGDFLISGEGPGYMQLAPVEKGLLWLDIETTSDGGHSSNALRGQTAVGKLAAILTQIDAINDLFADVPPELTGVSGGDDNLGLRVSLNAGTVEAGGVRSLIATKAHAHIDVRLPPGITGAEIERRVRETAADSRGTTIKVSKAWDASWTALANPVVSTLLEAATQVRGAAPQFVVRLPGSDARRWRDLGVPAICYGPQPTLSAGVDDYVDEQDALDCTRVYARAAVRLMHG